MAGVILHNTPLAHWYSLLHDAQAKSHVYLNETLESYLAFLLMRFMRETDLDDHDIAMEFLTHAPLSTSRSHDHLQYLGDKCLLFSGFFSERQAPTCGRIRYLVDIGQSAYEILSTQHTHENRDVFSHLARKFTSLSQVLTQLHDHDQTGLLTLNDDSVRSHYYH